MYDLILRGGTVVDGKRSQPYAADICIREGRIARIAPEGGEEAREVVDVSGLTVAPMPTMPGRSRPSAASSSFRCRPLPR